MARAEAESGDHSYSWLNLAEIQAYDWDGEFAPEHLVLARFTARPDPLVE